MSTDADHANLSRASSVVDGVFHRVLDGLDDAYVYLDREFDLGSYVWALGDTPDLVEGHRHVPAKPLVGIELNPGPPKASHGKPTPAPSHPPPALKKTQAKSVVYNPPASTQARGKRRGAGASDIGPLVSAPAVATSGYTSRRPRISRSGDACVISHTELLCLVAGTTNFTATSYSMQPGLASVVPWLATQCVGWEKYRFRKLRAIYVPRCGTSQAGTVVLAPDYDAADSAPTNEVSAVSFHGASDDAPWKTSFVDFDMRRSKEMFLRNGPLAVNLDIKMYDFANLYVCTSDATGTWGKVFLEYEIELLNPQILYAAYVGGSVNGAGTASLTNPFGTAPTYQPGSLVAGVTSTGTRSRISLQNLIIGQKYVYTVNVNGTGLTALYAQPTGGGSVNAIIDDLVNAAGTVILDETRFTASASTDAIDISVTGTTATTAFFDIAAINTIF